MDVGIAAVVIADAVDVVVDVAEVDAVAEVAATNCNFF